VGVKRSAEYLETISKLAYTVTRAQAGGQETVGKPGFPPAKE
jgi:hypothetical protein